MIEEIRFQGIEAAGKLPGAPVKRYRAVRHRNCSKQDLQHHTRKHPHSQMKFIVLEQEKICSCHGERASYRQGCDGSVGRRTDSWRKSRYWGRRTYGQSISAIQKSLKFFSSNEQA